MLLWKSWLALSEDFLNEKPLGKHQKRVLNWHSGRRRKSEEARDKKRRRQTKTFAIEVSQTYILHVSPKIKDRRSKIKPFHHRARMSMSMIDRLEFVRRFPSLDLFLPQESPPRRIAKKTTLSANEVGEEAGKAVIG